MPRILQLILQAFARCLFIAFIFFAAGMNASAQTQARPEVVRGLQWLANQVQADGSLSREVQSIATPLQNRTETAQTLKAQATLPPALSSAIALEVADNTEYLARQFISQTQANQDASQLLVQLLSYQNEDGGLGGAAEFSSNALDTAWFLLALSSINDSANSANSAPIAAAKSAAIAYLLATQDIFGGYSTPSNTTQIHVTALVAIALAANSNTPATANALNRITSWLLTQQKTDGSFGRIDETSLAYLALLGTNSDTGLQTAVSLFLLSRQAEDGSWGGDAYQTALALRALTTQARPIPTTGKLVLRVVDSSIGQPIGGATAMVFAAQNLPAVSDATGQIIFSNVIAGVSRIAISAPGYTNVELNFTLQAGTTLDLGIVKLQVAPTKGILKGQVKDAATGRPLSDATVTISGSAGTGNTSVQTGSDGAYNLPNLEPGNVTVKAAKTGYTSIQGTGNIVAGGILVFSPGLSLSVPGQPSGTTGSVSGQMIDAALRTPLAGVVVNIEGANKTTVSTDSGRFDLSGIPAGSYPVSFTRPGYIGKFYAAVLIAADSVADFQTIELAKAINTVVVQGKVLDLNTGRPIAQVNVTVLGAGSSTSALLGKTDANGQYRIEGLAVGNASLRFGASGYASETVSVNFPAAGEFILNQTLSLDNGGNPFFAQMQTDQTSYGAYAPVTVQMSVENRANTPIEHAVLDITVFDPAGSVIQTQQAIRMDNDGVAQNQFTFLPGSTTPIETKWSTQAYAPGIYQVKARIFTEDVERGARTVLAERTITLVINPSQNVLRLSVTPLPGFSALDATETMRFKVEATHQSNLPVNVPFTTRFTTPDGILIKEESGEIVLQPNDLQGAVILGPFTQHFTASGVYPVRLSATGTGTELPQAVVDGEVQVAPGIRVEAQQTVTPKIVTPDGDKRIRIQLQLKGVEQK